MLWSFLGSGGHAEDCLSGESVEGVELVMNRARRRENVKGAIYEKAVNSWYSQWAEAYAIGNILTCIDRRSLYSRAK
jgi:hypothetical protein